MMAFLVCWKISTAKIVEMIVMIVFLVYECSSSRCRSWYRLDAYQAAHHITAEAAPRTIAKTIGDTWNDFGWVAIGIFIK